MDSKIKLKKSDKLQLQYLDCNGPWLEEYLICISNETIFGCFAYWSTGILVGPVYGDDLYYDN